MKYFGTDGIRGRAGDELSPELALKAGYAIATVLKKYYRGEKLPFARKLKSLISAPAIALGRDTRLSSPMLADAVRSGILSAQVNVVDLGIIPTPALALAINFLDVIGGVMITASHNPIQDNGIKVFRSNGLKSTERIETEVEAIIDNLKRGYSGPRFGCTVNFCAEDIYISHLKRVLRGFNGDGLKVALDLAHGATTALAEASFSALGFSPLILNGEPDGWRVNVNCGATDTSKLRAFMRRNHISLGFAFDGDGDRAIAVDEKYSEVNGDKMLCTLALLHRPYFREKKIVFTEMTNQGTEDYLTSHGFTCYRTGVGDISVLNEMLRRQINIGGEQSGHIILWRKHCTGDGIFVSLFLAGLILKRGLSLGKLTEEVPDYPQFLSNVKVADKLAWRSDDKFLQELEGIKRGYGRSVRFYIRPSGTENCVRVLTESRDRFLALEANRKVSALFERFS